MKRPTCSTSSTLSDTQEISYKMFMDKDMSLQDIVKERNLQPSTIMQHLAVALEMGYFVDYRRGISISFLCKALRHCYCVTSHLGDTFVST